MLNRANNQEREARVFLNGVTDAIAEIDCAMGQSHDRDDHAINRYKKCVAATLRNLKRRIDAA